MNIVVLGIISFFVPFLTQGAGNAGGIPIPPHAIHLPR
jgi:hypothetical protein